MLEAKLARKKHANDRSSIAISRDCRVGGKELLLIGGPCAIEDMDQMKEVEKVLSPVLLTPSEAVCSNREPPPTLSRVWEPTGLPSWKRLAESPACPSSPK